MKAFARLLLPPLLAAGALGACSAVGEKPIRGAGGPTDASSDTPRDGAAPAPDVAGQTPGRRCSNGVRDGDETDVDCGGLSCARCAEGKGCASAADCVPAGQCVVARCTTKAPLVDATLVGYWPFDTGPADASGMKNDATVLNATAAAVGKVGGAYQLSGSGCLLVRASPSLAMAGGNTLTMMAWVNTPALCAEDHEVVLNLEQSYQMGIACGAAMPTFQEAIQPLGTGWGWLGTKNVALNAWQHVAVVWDGTTETLYLDGAMTDSFPLAGQLSDRMAGLGIGCRNVPSDGSQSGLRAFFVGSIDEVAIYRRALGAAEIRAYYDATR